MSTLKSDRLVAALGRAIEDQGDAELLDLLERSSGLPGPRANHELARALGGSIASYGARGDRLVRSLGQTDDEFGRIVAAMALAAQSTASTSKDRAARSRAERAVEDLQALAEDPRQVVRLGIVAAVRVRLEALGEVAVDGLASWMDGYLQAHIALEAMADRTWLTTLPSSAGVLARLDEGFTLADLSPRAAERAQGMRVLRQGLPDQIAVFAGRFRETLAWLEAKTKVTRPETREVVASAVRVMRRSVLSDVEALRFTALLEASAKPRRDADRVVHGTRQRGRGRT